MGTTPYLANLIINAALRAQTVVFPSSLYVGLFTDDPTAAADSEVTADDYARQAITFTAPLDGQTRNAADVAFGTLTSSWGDVAYYAIFDALTTGNMLHYEAFDVAVSTDSDDTVTIPAGTLVIDLE